jgi:hypothetical protein
MINEVMCGPQTQRKFMNRRGESCIEGSLAWEVRGQREPSRCPSIVVCLDAKLLCQCL